MTSTTDDTRDGKGRVRPGPSPSPYSRLRSRWAAALPLLGSAVTLVGTAASSVFGTQAHQFSSPAALALVAAFGAFLGVVMSVGLSGARSRGLRDWLVPFLAGAAGFGVAPWIVMANRYTDAPPGSEVVFFTTAAWGAMLAFALAVRSHERLSRSGGILLALAGAAAVVANWERPSSFSPFVRYPREELLMLLAGVLWVVLVLVLLRAARRKALAEAALRASLGGLTAAVVLAALALSGGTLAEADFSVPGLWAFGFAVAFATSGMLIVLKSKSAEGVMGAYLLVPAAMSLLLLLEQVVGVFGPNPMQVGPVLAAAVCTFAGLLVARSRRPHGGERRVDALVVGARVGAVLSLAAGIGSLALPGMVANVQALRADGSDFQASFALYGYETAGAWVALALAVAVLGITFERTTRPALWPPVLALAAAAVAWPFLADTPFRTLTSFIPSDVQVDYGSEFARIDFAGQPPVLALIALGGALLAVAVLLFHSPAPRSVEEGAAGDDREVVS